MSNPILVEVIETKFIPGLIYNNKKEDAAKLARFKEPSWNNPVVRFLSHELKDIVRRKDEVWSTSQVASRIIEALDAVENEVPGCLDLVRLEGSRKTEFATFAMHCYWEGEVQLGQLKGVKETQSAWYDKKEVVNVAFDPTVTSYEELLKRAIRVRCASTVYVRSPEQQKIADQIASGRVEKIGDKEFGKPAKANDQKYYLEASPIRLVPMTKTQRVRVNSALGLRVDPKSHLSNRQVEMSKWIQDNRENKSLISELAAAKNKMDWVRYYQFVNQRMK